MQSMGVSLSERVIEAINGYGQVVDLKPEGRGEICGSLDRITSTLGLLIGRSEAGSDIHTKAERALNAISERERINGTPEEAANPARFERLTVTAREALRELRANLMREQV